MSLFPETIFAIQVAGAAVYNADAELKKSVQEYANRVQAAMLGNPCDFGNDSLFEDWKTVARLSQAIAQLEVEIKKIYVAATALGENSMAPGLAKPDTLSASVRESAKKIQARDVVIKETSAVPKKSPALDVTPRPLSGNSVKVLSRLSVVLSTDGFTKINKTNLAEESGLPQGSIGASLSKLLQSGYLLQNGQGLFKLAIPKVT